MTARARGNGEEIEAIVVGREPYDPVEQREGSDASWCDAHAPTGRPVEIKACLTSKSHGPDRELPGGWWIAKPAHERLLEARGWYHLVVYRETDDDQELEIVREGRLPARIVDALIGSWTSVGDRSGSVADQATRLRHDRVFGRGCQP